ncbi:MAG: c-type cytochrome domain-containing protein [Phycisphaeraceae bacterium]
MYATRADRTTRLIRFFCPALSALVLIALVGPALAESAGDAAEAATGDNRSWGAFFGRTHILLLHLPIGLLIGAFAIEVFGFFRRSRGYDTAAAWLFVLGFLSSVAAVGTGLLLGTEQVSDKSLNAFTLLFADADQGVSDTLSLHMWLGTTLMVVAGVAAVLKVMAVRRQWQDDSELPHTGGVPLALARISLVGVMVAMPFVGHLGGNMTKQPDYLTERAPDTALGKRVVAAIDFMNLGTVEKPTDTVIVKGDDGVEIELANGSVAYWNAKIQPVLNNHCTACHNDQKQNGKLRLDSLEWAVKGGSVGGTIEPGNAEFSEIYRRVVLPRSHDEFMPTNIKKYGIMSQEDVNTLGEWLIAFDGELTDPEPAKDDKTQATGDDKQPDPAKPLIDPAAIRAIEDAGGSAQSLSQEEDPDLLDVKFAYLKTLDPEAVAKIGNTANQVAWLDLQGSSFGDEAAQQLPAMPKLTKLNLKDTAITDEGVAALPDLPALKWLNLFGTAITDKSLDALADYTALDKLYLTGTKVTAQGVAKLREALPDTEVFSDFDAEFNFTQDQPQPQPEPQDKPANEQAGAKPVNTACPVSGAPVKAGFVSTFEGKVVGFCCNNCKGQFDADPAKFAAKLAE